MTACVFIKANQRDKVSLREIHDLLQFMPEGPARARASSPLYVPYMKY